jgi:HEAT repeat protein
MTTPTSPDRPRKVETGLLAPTIDAIVGGDFSRSRLAALSDLDRARAASLRQRWLEIPPTERHALLLALAELAGESVDFNFNRVYRIALRDPDPVIRQLAIADLWEDEGRDLPAIFIDLVRNDPSDDVRGAAADALSSTTDAIAEGELSSIDRGELIDLFTSIVADPTESPIVRRRSLGAVAVLGDDSRIIDMIRLALDEDDQALVAGAIYAMGRTASARWIPELIDYLQSEDAELRFEAARASGSIGDEDVVPELAQLVYDPDAEVRAAALLALGAIGGAAAIRVLRQVEEDEEFEELEYVDDAIDAALLTVNPLERQS